MTNLRRILKNAFFLAGTNGVNLIVAFAFAGLTSRYLGKEAGFGRMMSVLFLATSLEGVVRGSAATILTQRISQNGESAKRYWWPAFVMNVGFSAFFLVGGLIGALALHYDRTLIIASVIAAWITIGKVFGDSAISIQRGGERMEPEFWTTLLERALYLLAVIWVTRFYKGSLITGFYAIFAFNVLTQWIQMTALVIPLMKELRPSFHLDRSALNDLYSAARPLWSYGLLYMLHLRLSFFMTQLLSTAEALGIYSAAFKLIDVARIIPWFLCMSIFPALNRHAIGIKDDFDKIYAFSLKILLLLSVPFAGGLYLISGPIVRHLYPIEFVDAIRPLRWLSLAIIPVFLNALYGYGIVSIGKQRTLVKTYAVAVVLQEIACLILIPRYGVLGATVAYMAGETGLLLLTLFITTRAICPLKLKDYWGAILCVVITIVTLRSLALRSLLLAAVAGTAAYAFCLLALPVFSKEERKRLRNLFPSGE